MATAKEPAKLLTGLTGGGLIVLFALYGDKFWVQARAAWLFLLEITSSAPLGLAAFFASWALATLVVLTMRRWIHPWRNKDARRFFIEGIGLGVAIHLSWWQMRGPDASTFDGVLFGVLAGLIAPLTATFLFAITTAVKHKLGISDENEPENPPVAARPPEPVESDGHGDDGDPDS